MKNIQGQTEVPQLIAGWKVRYVDADGLPQIAKGTTFQDWVDNVPADGIQTICIYYNRFDTEGKIRYRQVGGGYDYYFCYEGSEDLVIGGNTDTLENNEKRYPTASFKLGKWIEQSLFLKMNDETMEDYCVSDLGIDCELDTSDN